MKSYVRHADNPRNAYFSELERALQEGFQAGVAHALFCIHLNNGFGGERLRDLAETMRDTVGKTKGRCTDVKAEMDMLKNKYGVDVSTIKPIFEVRQENTSERNERLKNDQRTEN